MSQGYAVDFYGLATYGYSQPLSYSVEPFNIIQRTYGDLSLTWKSPNNVTWKSMQLVSSLYGYPSSPADGIVRLTITPSVAVTSFDDIDLLPGRIYYYTMFISVESPIWDIGTSYSLNQIILYNGSYWKSTQNSNVGNTPSATSTFWVNSEYIPTWLPAGYAASLVVTNYGYSQLLYDRSPQPYKIVTSDLFANTAVDNPALYHYLSIFGYHLDMTKTEYDLYLSGNNPDLVASSSLDILGQQLGLATDYLSSPQRRRERVKNATINYQLKGTEQGIHNAIASISGWDSEITYSSNLMLSKDQAEAYHPRLNDWNDSIFYFVADRVQFNNYNYQCIVQAFGAAQAPTGTASANTWWTPLISTTASPILDTTTLRNPKTWTATDGGFSTWAKFSFANSRIEGVYTGLPHPTDSTIKNWNGFDASISGAPGATPIELLCINATVTPAWSNATNYVINNFVSTNAGVNLWQAVKASGPGTPHGFITPGSNELFWKPVAAVSPSGSIDGKRDWLQDSIPVTDVIAWDAAILFTAGTQVEYFGIVYEAIQDTINSQPTGYYYSNENWIFIQPAEYTYVASAYMARMTTDVTSKTTRALTMYLTSTKDIYDAQYSNAVTTGDLLFNYLDRFIVDYSDLNGVNDNTLTELNRPWVASPSTANLWRSSFGMAWVDQDIAGTTTYNRLYVVDGNSDIQLGITFVSDYFDPIHYGHGIMFRYQDDNNFWYTTRQSLYKVVAGVETLMDSWPRLIDGDRMLVALSGTAIFVSKYSRDGTGDTDTLSNINDGALLSASRHGIIQKYSPSGAV